MPQCNWHDPCMQPLQYATQIAPLFLIEKMGIRIVLGNAQILAASAKAGLLLQQDDMACV